MIHILVKVLIFIIFNFRETFVMADPETNADDLEDGEIESDGEETTEI